MSRDGCAMDHGYRCKPAENDDFLSSESQAKMVSGNFLKAWESSWQHFLSLDDLTPEQKQIKHYKFGFTESDQNYIVLFQALLLPHVADGEPLQVSSATLGRTIRFEIDKSSFEVVNMVRYK